MPLQFFDDVANETHGDKITGPGETAKSIRRGKFSREVREGCKAGRISVFEHLARLVSLTHRFSRIHAVKDCTACAVRHVGRASRLSPS
jgi:hypothetical protein